MRVDANGQNKATLHKEIQSSMIPFPGLTIEDVNELEIKEVVYNIEGDHYFVTLSPIVFDSEDHVDSGIEMYKEYGWKIVC